jgi:hypothetical protein
LRAALVVLIQTPLVCFAPDCLHIRPLSSVTMARHKFVDLTNASSDEEEGKEEEEEEETKQEAIRTMRFDSIHSSPWIGVSALVYNTQQRI